MLLSEAELLRRLCETSAGAAGGALQVLQVTRRRLMRHFMSLPRRSSAGTAPALSTILMRARSALVPRARWSWSCTAGAMLPPLLHLPRSLPRNPARLPWRGRPQCRCRPHTRYQFSHSCDKTHTAHCMCLNTSSPEGRCWHLFYHLDQYSS